MRSRWTALAFVLVLAGLTPRVGSAQGGPPQTQTGRPKGGLGQSFPNPTNPDAKIPFTIGDAPACTDGGKKYVVTLTIYNALAQKVAVPLSSKGGRRLEKLELTCDKYEAYWDGTYDGTRRQAASGVYSYVLEVDGYRFPRRTLTVAK